MNQLTPQTLALAREGDDLILHVDPANCYERVSVLRAFPLTDPQHYWSLHDTDGQEIGIIVGAGGTGRRRSQAFGRGTGNDIISRLSSSGWYRLKNATGNSVWSVETDRGPSLFRTRALREVVLAKPVPFRYIISGIDGNRYDVAGHQRARPAGASYC